MREGGKGVRKEIRATFVNSLSLITSPQINVCKRIPRITLMMKSEFSRARGERREGEQGRAKGEREGMSVSTVSEERLHGEMHTRRFSRARTRLLFLLS